VVSDPQEGECLVCYLVRMLDDAEHEEGGCDGTLRWAQHFREVRSPTATGLEKRYPQVCDCGVLASRRLVRELMVRDVHTDELEPPSRPPTCAGVRRTSTHPCANWERVPRR
jgi:hypothetical protein